MITVSHEEIMKLKYADRETVPGLEKHADGACIHIGQISPSCEICFTGVKGGGVQLGQECMYDCPECYYDRDRCDEWEGISKTRDVMRDFFRQGMEEDWNPKSYSFQSSGETLMYIDRFMPLGPIFRNIENQRGTNIYHTLYTNGVLIDEEMLAKLIYLKIREIRFHTSASDFSDEVFKAMELVRDNSEITLSVEEPAMPHRCDKLIDHLDDFEALGVKHMNIVEVQITQHNKPFLDELYPKGRMYKEHFYHLYDEGMAYEIMRQRQKRKHHYSVLDCNSMVESYRHGKNMYLGMNTETLEGMCAPFPFMKEDE